MIVRISGEGQFEVDDDGVHKLDELDTALTRAYEARDERVFREELNRTIEFVRTNGNRVPDDRVLPSEVIVPPPDVDIQEAHRFFTDEGLMAPIQA